MFNRLFQIFVDCSLQIPGNRFFLGRGSPTLDLLKVSVARTVLFPIALIFLLSSSAEAWNPDVAYGLPKQRRMCVQRDAEGTVTFTSVPPDEQCPDGTQRYVVVFGKEPKGAIGMIASSTSHKIYPPLTLEWPAHSKEFSGSPLWHFTCVKPAQITVLEMPVEMLSYKGEITSNGKKDCSEAQARALKFCQEQWRGESLIENCPIGWGIE